MEDLGALAASPILRVAHQGAPDPMTMVLRMHRKDVSLG
jgi:hypothetical protein